MSNGNELIDVAVEIEGETEKALRLNAGTKTEWVPKSQVELHFEHGKSTIATMPMWLARDKGFI